MKGFFVTRMGVMVSGRENEEVKRGGGRGGNGMIVSNEWETKVQMTGIPLEMMFDDLKGDVDERKSNEDARRGS